MWLGGQRVAGCCAAQEYATLAYNAVFRRVCRMRWPAIVLVGMVVFCGMVLALLWWAGSPLVTSVGTASTGAASDPATGHAYILDAATASVLVLDTHNGRRIGRVPLGGSPDAVAVDTRRQRMYVAVGDANVPGSSAERILDTRTNRAVGRFPVPAMPLGIAVDARTGRIVLTTMDGAVRVLDRTTCALLHTWQPPTGCRSANFFPLAVAVSMRTRRIFVVDHNNACVWELDATTYALLRTVLMGRSPHGVVVDGHTGHVFVANLLDRTVSVLDGRSGAVQATLRVGVSPYAHLPSISGRPTPSSRTTVATR